MTTLDMREWAKTGDHYVIDYKKIPRMQKWKREREVHDPKVS